MLCSAARVMSRLEEPLCCCEFVNKTGDRSHLLACCCDCEDFDNAFDRFITCKSVPLEMLEKVWSTFVDRCRIPGCRGQGAIQIRLDVIVPIFAVPLSILLAAVGPVMTVLTLLLMPISMLLFYRAWQRQHKKLHTKFFYIWALTSVLFTYLIFQTLVVAFREILLWEIMLLLTALLLMMYTLMLAKGNPGIIKQTPFKKSRANSMYRNSAGVGEHEDDENSLQRFQDKVGRGLDVSQDSFNKIVNPAQAAVIPENEVTWVDSRPIIGRHLITWCGYCGIQRAPRVGHCSVCNACITVRDHHCVWIDNCIGAYNHRSFLLSMLLFVFCGFYGSHLTLTTVCTPEMYFDWLLFPSDCRFLYSDFMTSVCFATACYAIVSTVIMTFALMQQLVLISQNVTSQEMQRAALRGMTWFGIYAQNNVHNQGLLLNWTEFIFQNGRRTSSKIPV